MSQPQSILEQYPAYEVVIGMEVHVQLMTNSKIFCSCKNSITVDQNSNICQICCGYPGSLPVLNKQVVNYAILAGLATNCTIAKESYFDRKHYFYPDLPKNYQITQNDFPICRDGHIMVTTEDNHEKRIRIMRIHMEEDAGKNVHAAHTNESFVNLNRAGTPLLEIVTHPDISSTHEVKSYLKNLRNIVTYLGICSGNMEEGAFRADTNISVRKKGATEFGTRVELKNINSFKFIGDAVEYEIERQITALEAGEKIIQQTRLWDTKNKKTVAMRSKEEAADYRYLRDPDLPIITIDDHWLNLMKSQLPELPAHKHARLMNTYHLSAYEADILIDEPDIAHYYEQSMQHSESRSMINWVLRDVIGYLKEHKTTPQEFLLTPDKLAALVNLVDTGKINNHAAKEVFTLTAATGKNPVEVVKEKGLEQIGSTEELEAIVLDIIQSNPDVVTQYKAGKDKLFGFFVGQAMQKTNGKGNPKIIQELLKKHLA